MHGENPVRGLLAALGRTQEVFQHRGRRGRLEGHPDRAEINLVGQRVGREPLLGHRRALRAAKCQQYGRQTVGRRIVGPLLVATGVAVELQHIQLHAALLAHAQRRPFRPIGRSRLEDKVAGPVLLPGPGRPQSAVLRGENGVGGLPFHEDEFAFRGCLEGRHGAGQQHQHPGVGQEEGTASARPGKAGQRGRQNVEPQQAEQGREPRVPVDVPLDVLASVPGLDERGRGNYQGNRHQEENRQLGRCQPAQGLAGETRRRGFRGDRRLGARQLPETGSGGCGAPPCRSARSRSLVV